MTTPIALGTSRRPATSGAPRLQLRSRPDDAASAPPETGGVATLDHGPHCAPAARRRSKDSAPVLVAGKDAHKRARVVRDMIEVMPTGTRFEESGTLWEVLVHAPGSRMVLLSSGLDDVPAESLLHMLANRHPDLPVVTLEVPAPSDF